MTTVAFERICSWDDSTHVFCTLKGELLRIESFENGIAIAEPVCGCSITSFAEAVAGCFHEDSNFKEELLKAFYCNEDTDFTGIKFTFNNVTLLVTKENADKNLIYDQWNAGMEANKRKSQLEMEAYMKTPEYRAEKVKQLKNQVRKEQVQKEVRLIDEQTELEFRDDVAAENWDNWVLINSESDYGLATVEYALRWAKYMQHLSKKHNKPISKISDNASYLSDMEGITGFMHQCAANVLSECWKYGDELVIK